MGGGGLGKGLPSPPQLPWEKTENCNKETSWEAEVSSEDKLPSSRVCPRPELKSPSEGFLRKLEVGRLVGQGGGGGGGGQGEALTYRLQGKVRLFNVISLDHLHYFLGHFLLRRQKTQAVHWCVLTDHGPQVCSHQVMCAFRTPSCPYLLAPAWSTHRAAQCYAVRKPRASPIPPMGLLSIFTPTVMGCHTRRTRGLSEVKGRGAGVRPFLLRALGLFTAP